MDLKIFNNNKKETYKKGTGCGQGIIDHADHAENSHQGAVSDY